MGVICLGRWEGEDSGGEPEALPILTAPCLLPSVDRTLIAHTKALDPSRPMTFASYQPRVKIDYIFTSDHFTVRSASPLDERVSDHRPYLAELSL